LGLDLLGDGGEQVGLVTELVVERAAGHPGGLHDLLGAHPRVPARTEQAARGGEQHLAGLLRSEVVLGLGHAPAATPCRTDCLYVILIQTVCILRRRHPSRESAADNLEISCLFLTFLALNCPTAPCTT